MQFTAEYKAKAILTIFRSSFFQHCCFLISESLLSGSSPSGQLAKNSWNHYFANIEFHKKLLSDRLVCFFEFVNEEQRN